MKRIMYIENKGDSLAGPARIGWVTLSKSKRSYYYNGKNYYNGKTLKKVSDGYKYNCIDEETGDLYWISGPKIKGGDTLYGGVVKIDEDAREEYWLKVRKLPAKVNQNSFRG